jgi:phosphatidylinositol dimannoside acyltransferase
MKMVQHATRQILAHDAYWLRRMAYWGARYGSVGFAKHGAAAFGALFSGVLPAYRRVVRENLRRIHGHRNIWRENRDIVRTFVTYASCLTEALGKERMKPGAIEFDVVGREALDALLSSSTGFIVATAHVGAWDSAAQHLQQSTTRPVVVVMEREPNAAAGEFQDSIRTRDGVEVVHVGDDAFQSLKLLRHLRGGGIVAVQLDRRPKGGRTLPVALLGCRFEAPQGPFQLASLASVPIVPVFCARLGYYRYRVHVSPPIRLDRKVSHAAHLDAAQQAADSLEAFLRAYPTQWFHFERVGDPP